MRSASHDTKAAPAQFRLLQQPITHIAPTRDRMSWLAWLFLTVMRRISNLTMARNLKFIHFAHWQRVRTKQLPRLSPDQPREDFANDFFVFATNYNGDWDQYIDTFARVPKIQRGMWWLWRFCQGYPGPIPLRNFKQYIHYQTYTEALYYSAYPASTVRNITAARSVKKQVQAFIEASPPAEKPDAFKKRYLRLVTAIAPDLGSAPARSPFKIADSEPTGSTVVAPSTYLPKPKRMQILGPVLGRLAGRGDNKQQIIVAMSPIEVKPGHRATNDIAALIEKVGQARSPSPFAHCPMLHMARFVIIDDLRPKLGSSATASLRTNYLLFVAAIDGQVDDFLDCLYSADPKFVHGIWGKCLGYPKDDGGQGHRARIRRGPVYFRRYIARSLLPVQLPFVAFPGDTAIDIRGALTIHADMLEWMASVHCSQMTDAELMSRWGDLLNVFFAGAEAAR